MSLILKQSLIFTILILILCNSSHIPTFAKYDGSFLIIAVIGEIPSVKEEQIRFVPFSFSDLKEEEARHYDAVIVTEENVLQASESQYADIYLDSSTPFFFLSANSHIPFTVKENAYSEMWQWSPGVNYAVGILPSKKDNSLSSWGYGLYNGGKTEANIKEMYSRIFKTIAEVKTSG